MHKSAGDTQKIETSSSILSYCDNIKTKLLSRLSKNFASEFFTSNDVNGNLVASRNIAAGERLDSFLILLRTTILHCVNRIVSFKSLLKIKLFRVLKTFRSVGPQFFKNPWHVIRNKLCRSLIVFPINLYEIESMTLLLYLELIRSITFHPSILFSSNPRFRRALCVPIHWYFSSSLRSIPSSTEGMAEPVLRYGCAIHG